MPKKQIKSKERVADHGEVFTNEREVKAMCDLVEQECDRIDSRFLEPACGDGNFLAEVLLRKLYKVKKLYGKSTYDFERHSVLAVACIYGVDIMQDNIYECRERLFKIWNKEYKAVCKKRCNDETRDAISYILSKNILCGNALTMMQVNDKQEDTDMPIIFSHWSILSGSIFKRSDYRLDVLIKANTIGKNGDVSLLDDSLSEFITEENGEYSPLPIKDYPPTSYKNIIKGD